MKILSLAQSRSFLSIRSIQLPANTIPWSIVISYLGLILILPTFALIQKSLSLRPAEYLEIALSPVALSAYGVTFITAIAAGAINGVLGTIVAWVLVRYDFPLKRVVDAAIDIPFAVPRRLQVSS